MLLDIQCILGFSDLDYPNPRLSNFFHEFHCTYITRWWASCNVIYISTLTVFVLVLMLDVRKGCNEVVDTCI